MPESLRNSISNTGKKENISRFLPRFNETMSKLSGALPDMTKYIEQFKFNIFFLTFCKNLISDAELQKELNGSIDFLATVYLKHDNEPPMSMNTVSKQKHYYKGLYTDLPRFGKYTLIKGNNNKTFEELTLQELLGFLYPDIGNIGNTNSNNNIKTLIQSKNLNELSLKQLSRYIIQHTVNKYILGTIYVFLIKLFNQKIMVRLGKLDMEHTIKFGTNNELLSIDSVCNTTLNFYIDIPPNSINVPIKIEYGFNPERGYIRYNINREFCENIMELKGFINNELFNDLNNKQKLHFIREILHGQNIAGVLRKKNINQLKKLLRIRNNTHTRSQTVNGATLNKKNRTYTINNKQYIIPKSSIGISRKYNTLIRNLNSRNIQETLNNIQTIVQQELDKKGFRFKETKYLRSKRDLLTQIDNLINKIRDELSP
jgi:hypothetical protein